MPQVKSKYKSRYFTSLIYFIIILFVLSVLIAFVLKAKLFGNIKVNPNDVVLKSDANVVILSNRLPVSDKFGRTIKDDNAGAFVYFDFSVKNVSDKKQNYQLYLTKIKTLGDNIGEGYIKIYLTDQEDNPFPEYSKNAVPSYVELNYLKDKADSKNAYKSVILPKEVKKFRLRVWVSENYVVSNKNESFSFEIGARAI